MITYTAKSSVVFASTSPTLLVAADRDRTHLELIAAQPGVFFGDSSVSSSGDRYDPSPNATNSSAIVLEGLAATAEVYGVVSAGSIGVFVLEVVPL